MHGTVGGHFGMKCGRKGFAFADHDWVVAFCGQDFHAWASVNDLGGADEDHFEWGAAEDSLADRTFKLPAVGVAAHADIESI